jgi:glyoxylase-like metal-dependent hydrolase (beta-lactamase superfamily II)
MGTQVRLTLQSAGVCRVPELAVRAGGGLRMVDLPALFALMTHPTEGVVLFDTGYSPRFLAATRRLPYRVYRWLTPVVIRPEETAVAQLAAQGIAARDVGWVVVSHFDPDHIGGLRDFPRARVVCAGDAWRSVAGKQGLEALRARLLPGHLPADLEDRLHLIEGLEGPAVGPFDASHDLFGDGSVRLVALPGHAPGQLGAWVSREGGDTWLLAADACWTRATLTDPRFTVHELIAEDRAIGRQTYALLRRLYRDHPQVTIVPSHCPEAADELLETPRSAP